MKIKEVFYMDTVWRGLIQRRLKYTEILGKKIWKPELLKFVNYQQNRGEDHLYWKIMYWGKIWTRIVILV